MFARTAVVAFAAALQLCRPASARPSGPTTARDAVTARICPQSTDIFTIEQSAQNFVCLPMTARLSLWKPRQADRIIPLDDGVF